MATLMTKVRRAIKRKIPLTVRREYDPDARHCFAVRETANRSLSRLGTAATSERRDVVLSMCKDAGYVVDEVVADRTWVCHP